jgi:hypothetical protein
VRVIYGDLKIPVNTGMIAAYANDG